MEKSKRKGGAEKERDKKKKLADNASKCTSLADFFSAPIPITATENGNDKMVHESVAPTLAGESVAPSLADESVVTPAYDEPTNNESLQAELVENSKETHSKTAERHETVEQLRTISKFDEM